MRTGTSPPRNFVPLAFAIVISAVVLSSGILAVGSFGNTITKTIEATTATTATVTVITTTRATTTTTITLTTTAVTDSTIVTSFNESIRNPIPVSSVEAANITIGGSPRTIAVDPTAGRIYVEDTFSSVLTVVNASSSTVIGTVNLPADANNGLAVDYNTHVVYALVQGGVAEVNGTDDKLLRELPLDLFPGTLAYDPATQTIYGAGASTLIGANARTGSIVLNVSIGYQADSVAVDPATGMVIAAGCSGSFVCGSEASVVNGTSGKLVSTISLGSAYYPRVTLDSNTGVGYVSGEAQLAAVNTTNSDVIYNVNPQTCGPFDSMTVAAPSNQVFALSLNYNYVMEYDGTSGALVNMYSFPSTPQFVSFDPANSEVYATVSGNLIAFHELPLLGNVNSSLVGSGQNCLPV